MPSVTLTTVAGVPTVATPAYRLEVRAEPPRAVLADGDGRIWSALSLLADVSVLAGADESYAPVDAGALTVDERDNEVVVGYRTLSPVWGEKQTTLRCRADRLELTVTVRGSGMLTEVRLLGGSAVRPSGAAGTFRSAIEFATVLNPTPTEPVQVVRPAHTAATLGVLGDAQPGRLHAVFSPPPLCLAFGRDGPATPTAIPETACLAVGVVAPVAELTFTELAYEPLDGGFLLRLDYDGHTRVDGQFTTPTVVLWPTASPLVALAEYRELLVERGFAPVGPTAPVADWWSEPLFSGWGAQCARAPLPGAPSHPYFLHELGPDAPPDGLAAASGQARADVYDELLGVLERHHVHPGTVLIDDRWQLQYGSAEPDLGHWSDLRGWIAGQHLRGRRVLLWWKAWDPAGIPADECLVDPYGRPVAVDPANPRYRDRVVEICRRLLGPDGLNADGLEIDFTQRSPAGRWLRRAAPDGAWGIALLHDLLETIYGAAKKAKPDALVITHTPHPSFGDVCDMVRLNDVLERDPKQHRVPVADQLAFRAAVVAASLPQHLVDTDQWPMPDRAAWRSYVEAQARYGVPALYYAERIDRSQEALDAEDLALVARTWAGYRAARR